MKRIDIKKEIRKYYNLRNRKIKVNIDRKTFLVIVGDCVAEIKLPPHIIRELNLEELGIK